MNIVLEGPDNSGKSTLAQLLAERTGKHIVSSEGPPAYEGEINERIRRYMLHQDVIFDRHPVISDPIYSSFRVNAVPVEPSLIREFYATRPFIIYCKGNNTLDGHQVKGHDSESHLAMVQIHMSQLCRYYDDWALEHAHMVYRMNDSLGFAAIMRALAPEFDPVADIANFHRRFSLQYTGRPRMLPKELLNFRYHFMEEELDEYRYWTRKSGFDEPVQLEGALDSLVDLIYVALGTAYMHGFNFREAWRRVHEANMKKVRVENASDSKRNSKFDVVKPQGWQAPSLKDLVQ